MSFEQFLNPQRKPPIRFTMEGFGDAVFEMKVISHEEYDMIREQYPDISEQFDAICAYSLTNPRVCSTDFMSEVGAKIGRTVIDPLDAYQCAFAVNECNVIWSKYNELAGLKTDLVAEKEKVKNG